MQVLTLERNKTTRLFGAVAASLGLIMVITAKQPDPSVTAAGVLLAMVSLMPLYLWLLGSSHGLPIWPVYALVNGITAAFPMVQDPETLDAYTSVEIIIGGVTVMGFILLATSIWLSLTTRTPKPPANVFMIRQEHSVRYLMIFVYIGVLFLANQIAWWFALPGNSMQVARGVASSLNWMGLFVLSFYHGRGLLDRPSLLLLSVGALLTIALGLTSLMLAQALVPAALVVAGYTLGSNKLPWRLLTVMFVAAALLHPGKYQMREKFWSESGVGVELSSLLSFYQTWFGYGLEEVGGLTGVVKAPQKEDSRTSLFERAGSLHMLLLVQKKSPQEVPFLNGITYEPIPRLLIPRFLDRDKGISHAGNVMLTVNYGVQNIEQTATTSIYWGLIPEAYANFGYVGVCALAVFLALFFSWMTRLSVGAPMTSLRFVYGLLVLAASTKADTMGVFVTTQFQAMAGLTLAALVLMRAQPNPFAVQAVNGGVSGGEAVRRNGSVSGNGRGSASAANDYSSTSGMPAPGFLAGLIEGSVPQFGTGSSTMFPSTSGKTAMRATAWMPRALRMRIIAEQREQAALAAQGTAAAAGATTAGPASQRPRQVAVPYRNYRRYRE